MTLCSLLVCTGIAATAQNNRSDSRSRKLEQQFEAAVAQYNAGHLPEAAAQLEAMLPVVPNSFEVHELLGQVYASESQNAKAVAQFQAAVRLKPDSAAARTNLAASLLRAGNSALAGEQFRRARELEPSNYDANHNLGEFYIQSGKLAEALPFLEQAQHLRPTAYDNGYDLAQARFLTGHLADARQLVQSLIQQNNAAELHALLGQIDEKDGKFLDAANELETAAHMDPSEDNLFNWAGELLLHRTYEPAIQIFQEAVRRYPKSPRLWIGLGVAVYWRGRYDEAVKALVTAADLNPSDSRCYFFLSKVYDNSPTQAGDVLRVFRRYAELQPHNALAQYDYAMSLWREKRAGGMNPDLVEVQSLLERSAALDPASSDARLQLGNLYFDQHEYDKSIPEYESALKLNQNLPDAHYRLGQAWARTGQKDRAQSEFQLYKTLRAQHLAETDKEAADIQEFVYSAKDAPTAHP
ncbi:tetratricopeptide repeat protein [Paracidobacterium acidisoli]|uniref:Tetratricopeptide repeat protein n=1 Tax=Paracidobacterium acidisoli TaxID=2303751 RepID=A0A372IJ56_9BACT|nr:tetratricopeptide repeat protein [Paracidobacterium acidisoli]MBT9333174.1 tetratricopeptide repeat protein [Paracidobacterium acidisoli]